MGERHTVNRARELADASDDGAYGVLFTHGTMELGYYRPDRIDPQQPHAQDEIYVVQSGSGFFVCGDQRKPFEPGEALFVPAGVVHRFEEFTDDFAAWVVFYGPQGGELPR
ncbi:MAG: cupin domain-containing protein [Gammaproteobacteria bacterium]|nr:cupin domain-containing protein [Gammaproteobacteria bacterium]MDH5345940.1 cupin domain-containing protein [Gammaproteobacteria bacterium]